MSGVLLNIIDAGPAGEDDETTSDQSDDGALSKVHSAPSRKKDSGHYYKAAAACMAGPHASDERSHCPHWTGSVYLCV